MPTRNSLDASRLNRLAILSLALLGWVCFPDYGFPQMIKKDDSRLLIPGTTVTYRGNKFELSKEKFDTITVTDPLTGKDVSTVTVRESRPLRMNNEYIYFEFENGINPGAFKTGTEKEMDYVINSLKPIAKTLPDGEYELNVKNIVVDKNGHVAYFENKGLVKKGTDPNKPRETAFSKPEIITAINKMMEHMPDFSPAAQNNAPVNCCIYKLLPDDKIMVKNHHMRFEEAK